jgi:hypothetical protein
MRTCNYTPVAGFFLLVFMVCLPLFAQDDSRPWERLGLSLTEWKLIQDNNMPMSKVEDLLKDGIGISEYFKSPWKTLGMTEEQWITKRRSGLTSYDIEQEQQAPQVVPVKKEGPVKNTFQEYDASQENAELLKSFLMPGYMQYQTRRSMPGTIMIGLAGVAVAGCAGLSITKKQFISMPLFVVLVPDMVWSLADHKKYMNSRKP